MSFGPMSSHRSGTLHLFGGLTVQNIAWITWWLSTCFTGPVRPWISQPGPSSSRRAALDRSRLLIKLRPWLAEVEKNADQPSFAILFNKVCDRMGSRLAFKSSNT